LPHKANLAGAELRTHHNGFASFVHTLGQQRQLSSSRFHLLRFLCKQWHGLRHLQTNDKRNFNMQLLEASTNID
jgi:hypothetical protein